MPDEETMALINQLQQQQAMLTQMWAKSLEGKWTAGADTVEGLLYALDPNMTGTLSLDPPLTESDAGELPKG